MVLPLQLWWFVEQARPEQAARSLRSARTSFVIFGVAVNSLILMSLFLTWLGPAQSGLFPNSKQDPKKASFYFDPYSSGDWACLIVGMSRVVVCCPVHLKWDGSVLVASPCLALTPFVLPASSLVTEWWLIAFVSSCRRLRVLFHDLHEHGHLEHRAGSACVSLFFRWSGCAVLTSWSAYCPCCLCCAGCQRPVCLPVLLRCCVWQIILLRLTHWLLLGFTVLRRQRY